MSHSHDPLKETPSLETSRRSILKSAIAAGAAGTFDGLASCTGVQGRFGTAATQPTASTGPAVAGRGRLDAREFVAEYTPQMQRLYTQSSEAGWLAGTDVSDEHTQASAEAQKAFDAFVGDKSRMEQLAALRDHAWQNDMLVNRQLDRAWMLAAHAPGSIPELVRQKADVQARHSQTQDGFVFTLRELNERPRTVNTNQIDEILLKSTEMDLRLAAWTASKEIGVALKPGLVELQRLRNAVARELKFSSYFGLEVADYGMSVRELMELMRVVLEQTRPLYEQVHCYARHALARRHRQSAPRRIPAHWLPNRWGQEWPGLEESVSLDPLFADKTAEWIVQQAERFYVSMGFSKLPESFWRKSDLYELPAQSTRQKNRHASAWHIDLDRDVRSLMSVVPAAYWFTTAHHELGHIYYYLSYSRPDVPILLREGANRALHEAIGDLIGLASRQRPYLAEIGLLKPDFKVDAVRWLLAEAMDGNFVFLPFACGTMTGFEHDFYERDLPADRLNARWWELVATHQGIDPPAPRGEEYCDAASKTHINDDPAGYYDYAIGTLIVYQVHDYIARKILKQDPRACNYFGRKDVGEYLHALLKLGATRDWRQVLRDFTGEDLSARAMMEYYAPLTEFLEKENAGRDVRFD